MRKNIVAGNWKMSLTLEEGRQLTDEIRHLVGEEVAEEAPGIVLCPPFVHLWAVREELGEQDRIHIGGQNLHQEEKGADTGEVSAAMLQSVGCHYVIIGHSERRQYFQEGAELLAAKVRIALAHGLVPIFCCGESQHTRENEDYIGFVRSQLTASLFDLPEADFRRVVIAYEPIWAIGTGLTATSDQAQEMHAALRQHIGEKYGQPVAEDTSLLYGGSCKPSNAAELFACADVDGGLIGGASLKSRDFVDIIKSF